MKSFLLTVTCLAGIFLSSYAQSSCASYFYYQQEIAKDQVLFNRLQQAEEFINRFLKSDQQITLHGAMPASQPIIRIPVVVHIVYRVEEENISDQQVRSQIEVLNKEFRRLHADTTKIPSQFKSIAADCAIEFVLAKINPRGYATTGITRKKTSAYSFGLNDKIKFSTEGGDDGWDSDQYLNIWVANLQIGIAGYSSILGGQKIRMALLYALLLLEIPGS